MKTIVVLFVAFMSFGLGANAKNSVSKKEIIKIKTSSVCGMCKETIEKALSFEKGISKVDLDVKTSVVTVTFNPSKTDAESIKKAISMAGYDADDVKADAKAYDGLHGCCKKGAH